MGVNVSLKVPLTGKKDSFILTGPCLCCGAQGEKGWKYHKKYNLKRWEKRRKSMALHNYSEDSGKPALGELLIELPYCKAHQVQTNLLRSLTNTLGWVLGGIIILVTAVIYINNSLDETGAARTARDANFWICLAPIFVFFMTFVVMKFFQDGIKLKIGSLSAKKDLPLKRDTTSGCGLKIETEVDGGVPGEDIVRYFVKLDFQNPQAAGRFMEKYPQAVINGFSLKGHLT
jgi:hypothetical protein